MGNPDNSLPRRPNAVPAGAHWEPGVDWTDGRADDRGRQGLHRRWTREGRLIAETDYADDVVMNRAVYGEDGSAVRYYTRDGKANYTTRYFTREGIECGPDARPLPPRPTSVSDDARWLPDQQTWVDGATDRVTGVPSGTWRVWSRDGQLLRLASHDPNGHPEHVVATDARGTRTLTYEAGVLVSVVERTPSDVLAFAARRGRDGLVCMLYGADGATIAASGTMRDDKLVGVWKLFDARGMRTSVDVTPLELTHEPTGDGLMRMLGQAVFQLAEPPTQTSDSLERTLRGVLSADPLVRNHCFAALASEDSALVIPQLARLLDHPDADRMRMLAMIQNADEVAVCEAWPHVFARFPMARADEHRVILELARRVPGARADLAEAARQHPDPLIRARAITSITSSRDYALIDVLDCVTDKDVVVRAAAAIAIATTRGPGTPREVVTALRDAIHSRELARRFAELPNAEAHVLAYLALAAGAVSTPDARSLAQALCERFDDVDQPSSLLYASGLLELAFGKRERPFAKRFVEILETLAASKKLWLVPDAARDLLAVWNLPGTPDELGELVAAIAKHPDREAVMHQRLRG